jgi:hypothetical protein
MNASDDATGPAARHVGALPAGIDLSLLGLVKAEPLISPPAPVPLSYTNSILIGYLTEHPDATPATVAAAFGRPKRWFLTVLASNAFQLELDPVRHLITDPTITATMEERFRALTLHSLDVLSSKLDGKEVSDLLVLKAAEIGVKALGMGNPVPSAAPLTAETSVDTLADRLVAALNKQRSNVRAPVTVENDG